MSKGLAPYTPTLSMTNYITTAIGTTAALLSSIGLIAVASITTNFTVTGNSNPLISSAFKTGNGWSSGDYFGRRSSAPVVEQQITHSFRQGNGWSSGDYFGPKG